MKNKDKIHLPSKPQAIDKDDKLKIVLIRLRGQIFS